MKNNRAISVILTVGILSISGLALAGVCQGTTSTWTTDQVSCGNHGIYAQGFNAGGGFDKNLRVNKIAGTSGAAAEAVDSAGQAISSCLVTDTGPVDGNVEVTDNGCGPGVAFIYQVTF